jgi:hypothetical protein
MTKSEKCFHPQEKERRIRAGEEVIVNDVDTAR